MRKTWKIIKIIIYVAIITSSLFIIATSLNVFGFQAFIVKSGSMEPDIHTGSVVVDHISTDYKLKDVITFKISGSKDTVTHRIVKINQKTGVTSYQVKGDANQTSDPDPVLKTNVVGSVLFSIPLLGFLIAFIRSVPGLIIFIAIPALIIISEEISNIKSEVKKIANKDKGVNKKVADLAKRELELEAKEQRLQDAFKNIQNKNPKP
jgi:signal peptidase